MDFSFLDGILIPISNIVTSFFSEFLGMSTEQVIGLLALINLLFLWFKGKMVIEFIRTYWNVLGVILIILIGMQFATSMGWM